MKFITIRDLRGNSKKLGGLLKKSGKLVLTSNGKPIALLTAVSEDNIEDELFALRQARAMIALERVRTDAERDGANRISMTRVNKIINKTQKNENSREAMKEIKAKSIYKEI